MTEREKLDIQEQRLAIFARDNWTCRICNLSIQREGAQPMLGHRISQSMLYKYGPEIIYHPECMWTVCSMNCNHKAAVGKAHEAEEAERIRMIIGDEQCKTK